jgi:type VI secretion system protein ImpL
MERTLLLVCLVLLSLACSALIGWICVLTGQSVWWAAAPVVLFAVVLLVLWLGSMLKARLGARKLEQGLMQQAAAQSRAARPDQKQKAMQLHSDFERAVRDLKSSRLGRKGRDALYLLPWYAIIGPSGAGKTTALRNSGLRFPSMRNQENIKVRGVGGTRNCDFWMTNDAVLLDTAGRWSTQDDDHHEWLGFLQLLRKHRTKKPLNGLIAAIGIGDVVNASPDEIDALAERMRNRLEEVTAELRVSIPVYVLFTKCDLLEGFVEMFGGLRATEREQIMGFTVPFDQAEHSPEALFERYFDELEQSLRGAAIARMGEERAPRTRQLVYAFPEQFAATRRNLGRFIERLFESNVYRETLPLRGAYFSSGTQEGRPFNLLFEPSSTGAEVVDQKGYFLRELFMQVIFADKSIASASQAELKRQRALRVAWTAGFGLLTLAIGIVPASVFLTSRHQIAVTSDLVAAAESGNAPASGRPAVSPQARALFADLNHYEKGAPSFFSTMGMYTGGRVLPALRRYIANVMRRELVQPVVGGDLRAMTDFGLRYESLPRAMPTPAEHEAFYNALKLHLLLTSKAIPKNYTSWVEDRLLERWQEAEDGGDKDKSLPQLAKSYVQYTSVYPELAFSADADVVRRVRAALNRASAAQQTLDAIVAHVGTLGYDLDLQKLTGYNTALTGGRRIRGAFTRRGYENAVRDLFETGAPEHVDELWVLGLTTAAGSGDRAARLAELEALYFRAYVQEWRSFIESVRTRAARGASAEALALLSELTSGEPTPIGRFFQGVAKNVRLPAPPPSAQPNASDELAARKARAGDMLTRIWKRDKAASPRKAAAPQHVVDKFNAGDLASAFDAFVSFGVPPGGDDKSGGGRMPVPYDAYREQLIYLRDALQLRMNNPAETQQLEGHIETALVRVRGLIDTQPPAFRPVFEALLWPPIKGLREGAGREGASWTGGKWCSEVVAPFDETLAGHYPFSTSGRDARIDDLDAFYKPGEGLLWKFTSATLADQVQLVGEGYGFTAKYEHGGGLYNRSLLEFLDRSRAISRAFYPGGGGQTPRLDFSVRIHNASSKVDTTTISVGGKTISYDNGPVRWQSMTWPGPEPARGASFTARGRTIKAGTEFEGLWGLFRLLETGTTSRASDDAISVTWRLPSDDVAVWIELRPSSAVSPFFDPSDRNPQPKLLRLLRGPNVSAPHRIANSQAACR